MEAAGKPSGSGELWGLRKSVVRISVALGLKTLTTENHVQQAKTIGVWAR